jgi:glucokinase
MAAVNRVRTGKSAAALQRELVDFVVDRTHRLAARHAFRVGGISIGAAVDGHTGSILASAPLWGAELTGFDLAARLRADLPEISWAILNDVSALAFAMLASHPVGPGGKAAAVTISSGIAYRTIDMRSGRIPLEPAYGLQGEIGHLPSWMTVEGRPVSADCECGAADHVAAFSSGRGILRLLGCLPEAGWLRREEGGSGRLLEDFSAAVMRGDRRATRLLDAFTRPVAQVLLYQATLDPEVDRTVLTGGVVDSLGDCYLASLHRNLTHDGLYLISERDPGYFLPRIVRGAADGLQPLRGVGLYARGLDFERATPGGVVT